LRWESNVEKRAYELPESVKRSCLDYLKHSGLSYAAIAFLVTEDNEFIFLEANESGQFLFLEDEVPTIPILDAFCQFLASGSSTFKYTKPSAVNLANYSATDDAQRCQRLFEEHWNNSDKSSPFELAD